MPTEKPLSNRKPSFDRLRAALFCGQPDCVPALELFHDLEVKEAFLGRPVRTFADDVAFHHAAGYDYYSAWVTYRDLRREIGARLNKPETTTASPYENVRKRKWSPERNALIASLAEFAAFPWPEPGRASLDVAGPGLEPVPLDQAMREIAAALPEGMGLILATDGIFERFTKDIMGYETFCFKLADEPELVRRMFARVGELWLALYEEVAALPQVGALWLADDVAFGQGLLFAPQIMREQLFPWYRRIGEVAARRAQPFLFHSDGDLWQGVLLANTCARASDSLPAMVGALAGALDGARAIPSGWEAALRKLRGICIPDLRDVDLRDLAVGLAGLGGAE